MTDWFVEAFVDKLILLEQTTGARVTYRMMTPPTTLLPDLVELQTIAKQIAEFVGLGDFTFNIGPVTLPEKIGGHIDLSTNEQVVHVEVHGELMTFPGVAAATLCHELCHKWLQINGLRLDVGRDNEILTDITTVFLGLGKIMLNGCKAATTRYERLHNGTRTVTETKTVGYLDRDQLAFVYRMVCSMRAIPRSDFMADLNGDATLAVQRCDSAYGHHYDARFHAMETALDAVAGFGAEVVRAQRTMAELDKHLTYIKKSCCGTVDGFVSAGHRRLESLSREAAALTQGAEADPAMRFLRAIRAEFEVERMVAKIGSLSQEAKHFLQHVAAVGRHFFNNDHRFPRPSPAMFNIVCCPQDGTKLRLPESSGDLIATCPTCKYRFAYNTSTLSFREPAPAPRKLTWGDRIRGLLRRRRSG